MSSLHQIADAIPRERYYSSKGPLHGEGFSLVGATSSDTRSKAHLADHMGKSEADSDGFLEFFLTQDECWFH